MPLTIKITGPGAGAATILRGLPDGTTLAELQGKIQEATGLAPGAQRLKAGFPPKDVDTSDGGVAVTALGIASGSAVSVSQKEGSVAAAGGSNGSSSSSSSSSSGSGNGNSPKVQQLVDMGFPPGVARKALEMAHDDVEAALELCIGGMVTEEDMGSSSSASSSASASAPAPEAFANGRVMVRRVIDADNSCLFNAIGYCMDKDRKVGAKLRKIIADVVRNSPQTYSEAVLGKTPKEYSDWILDPKTWGGEVEMFILSQYYASEIAAIEIKSQHTYVYGEGKNYSRRIYLLYDGVHYDALAAAAGTASAPESMDQTQFPAGDKESERAALAVAAALKRRRQFVDLANFDLRCAVCNKGLNGQEEAMAHARATSHQNFQAI